MFIRNLVNLYIHKKKWRKANVHNSTVAHNLFDRGIVEVGRETYGELKVISKNNQSKLRIGNFCSIGPEVTFVLNDEHDLHNISTFPFKARTLRSGKAEAGTKGGIVIEDDVWLGFGSTILDGVTIGQGAIVGACSVVAKSVPPYAIVVGSPAKVIKYRFDEDLVEILKGLDFGSLSNSFITENIDLFYRPVDLETVYRLKACISNG